MLKIIVGEESADGGSVSLQKNVTLGYLRQDVAVLKGVAVRDEVRKGLASLVALGDRLRSLEESMATLSDDELDRAVDAYGTLQAEFEKGGFQIENRVEEILSGLGFSKADYDRDCGELSGGWQMRVVLARLLLQGPDILLLDEPTNHLDLDSLQWLENFLQNYEGSLVFVSHDRWFLNRLSSHIAELSQQGLRVYKGNFDAYLKQVTEEQELLERRMKNQQRRRAELERFISRFRAKATKAKQVQSRVKALSKMEHIEESQSERTIQFSLPEPPKSGQVLMTLQGIRKTYGTQPIYDGLCLELLKGRRIALVGPNGAGKTTLLKILAGALQIDSGQRALGFGAKSYYFAQHQVESLSLDDTVLNEAQSVLESHTLTQIRGILGAFLFGNDDVDKQVRVLSGGEKARLALVKMLLTPSNLLLLDEPTNHLDMASRAVLEAALSSFTGTLVLISHDRHFLDAVCNEVWEIAEGQVTPFLGDYTEYRQRIARGDRPEPLPLSKSKASAGRAHTPPKAEDVPSPSTDVAPTKIAKTIDWSGGQPIKKRRSRVEKREAAQIRQRRSSQRTTLKRAADTWENQVQDLERQIALLQEEQTRADHYDNPDRVREVAQLVARLSTSLDDAYVQWETAGEALERFDEETQKVLE